jgi:NAD+ diphosphatase
VNGPPPLARSTVDRAAHRRTDDAWLAAAFKRGRTVVVDVVAGGKFRVRGDALVFAEPEAGAQPGPEHWFLGEDADGTPYFGTAAPLDVEPGTRLVNLRDVGHLLNDRDAGLAATAVALAHWHAGHPYSPTDGRPTTSGDGGWVRRGDGDESLWPRTDPAVIMLVHDGVAGPDGRCLLGHNAAWATAGVRRFSCLAGFVEPGESAEAAVAREVFEEVGVRVDRVTYLASQPWPFPCSLMLGFTAHADPGQPLSADATEITHAHWFTRRDIAAVLAGEKVLTEDGERMGLPMAASIAHHLLLHWLAGGPRRPWLAGGRG